MNPEDLTEHLVAALNPYFSAPLAKALLTATVRRASLVPGKLPAEKLPTVVTALERTLPSYIVDETRRTECIGRLRRLLALVPEVPGVAPSTPSLPPPAPAAAPAPVVQVAPVPTAPSSSRQPSPAPAAVAASTSTVIHIRGHDDVGNASEACRDIARKIGFSQLDQTKIATAASELARNILLYAKVGDVRISSLAAPRRGIEIIANDKGPGIPDVALVMSGAYRSRTGMGMGLKGTKRLMDVFEITSSSGAGTNITTRKFIS